MFELAARFVQRPAQHGPVFDAKNDIFEDGKILDQFKVLEHHSDAGGDCGLAVGYCGFLTIDEYLTGIGFVKAVEDRHQRGFARAILTNDAMHSAFGDID